MGVFMRRIRAINGRYIKVSDCDYEFLRQFRWMEGSQGYFRCSQKGLWLGAQINNKRIHQFVMLLNGLEYPEGMSIDHVDRDPSNNTHENLRFATLSSQNWNTGLRKDNTSRLKGVHADGNKWIASIGLDGKQKYLGTYKTKEAAYAAYMLARAKLEKYEPIWGDLKLKRCADLEVTRRVKTSRFVGVHKISNKKWVAQIGIGKNRTYLGVFEIEEQASEAYQKAKQELDIMGVVIPNLKLQTSKYPGVNKVGKRWRAKIRINNHQTHIGYFNTEEEASEAYQTVKRELCLN